MQLRRNMKKKTNRRRNIVAAHGNVALIYSIPAPMVEANVVEVALKLPNVGVLVATIPPVPFVERMELMA